MIGDMILWLMWEPLRWITLRISLKNLKSISRLFGVAAYHCQGFRRHILNKEFGAIFPEKSVSEVNEIVRSSIFLRCLSEFEETLYKKINAENICEFNVVINQSMLDDSLCKGKGVILVTFHFGAYLQVMPALGMRGYQINQVAVKWTQEVDGKTKRDRYWATKLHRARLQHAASFNPANVIAVNEKTSMRPLFRCLGKNEILIVAMDGRKVGRMMELPFFHHGVYRFARGPAAIALKTNAPLHPVFVIRDEKNRNKIIIQEEIVFDKALDTDECITSVTKKLVKQLEEMVRKYPDHYASELFHEQINRIKLLPEN